MCGIMTIASVVACIGDLLGSLSSNMGFISRVMTLVFEVCFVVWLLVASVVRTYAWWW
jgi:hypothetical protein